MKKEICFYKIFGYRILFKRFVEKYDILNIGNHGYFFCTETVTMFIMQHCMN